MSEPGAPGLFTPVVNSMKFILRRQNNIDSDKTMRFRITGKVEIEISDKEGNVLETKELDISQLENMLNS